LTVRSLSASPARLGLMQAADYEQALEAAREWYAVHGRLPQAREWERAGRGRPTARTIRRRRWRWDRLMLEATGRDPADAVEEELRAYRRQLLLTLRAARDQLGRWPGGRAGVEAGQELLQLGDGLPGGGPCRGRTAMSFVILLPAAHSQPADLRRHCLLPVRGEDR
jgi:hypothetical protein